MQAAIETSDLTKRRGETAAVKELNLSIPQGSVYGFLGPNGAGKTTTIQMLTTLLPPSSGSARILSHSISKRSAVRKHVGYLPETPPLYEELTAREQLKYIADLRDCGEQVTDRIDELLDRLGLLEAADEPISTYSKGMSQKTAFVQAVLHEPDVLFLDEPISGLDPRAARTLKDIINEFADENVTVFLSTHILEVADELADKVGVLYDGEVLTEGPPDQLKRRAETEKGSGLEEAFLQITDSQQTGAAVGKE